MTAIPLLPILLLLQAPKAPASEAAELRSVNVVVTDDKGAPVEGLVPEEVALLENGLARDVATLVLDRRPLTMILLVDTSQATSSFYRLNMLDPVVGFLKRLPEGSQYALWTTGDRPTKLVDFTSDAGEASRALMRVAPQGGNTMLDALVEASAELKKKEAERTAVVAVSAIGIEFSSRNRYQVTDEVPKNTDQVLALQIDEGETDADSRFVYDYVFSELAKRTGGLHETVLSSLGIESSIKKLTAYLRGGYRLSYATLPGIKNRKLEVKVARPGVKVRLGQSRAEGS
jgi:VWFA-related protein